MGDERGTYLSFLAALQFLTSIPVTVRRELTAAQLGRSTAWFPAVGLIIGGTLALFNWLLAFILPRAVVSALLIVILAMLTGALHLDGLADTCDGLAGRRSAAERWRIMRDSHTGAFGVIGIVLVLLVKYISLNSVAASCLTPALVFMPVVSRWAMVYAVFAFPYARPAGLGGPYKQATHWPQFTVATAFTVVVAAALFPIFASTGLLLIPGVWIIATILAFYLKRKFAGLTGDTYGAINEVGEATALILTIVIFTTLKWA
jgi:adenosylcobinamide-GDP ribazoletransferase